MAEILEREAYLAKRKEQYLRNKERIAAQNKVRYFKNPERFREIRNKTKEKNSEKIKESNKRYRQVNKEKISAWHRNKRNENNEECNKIQRIKRANRTTEQRERDSAYAKRYREENRERIIEYHKSISERRKKTRQAWHTKKYRSDPHYKILHNLRSRIKTALKGTAKDSTTIKLIGCDMKTFKLHIEKQFKFGMSWEHIFNGEIHIDHIKPCKEFELTKPEEQKKCFHYSNLQPLWWYDNLKKGAKYEEQKAA